MQNLVERMHEDLDEADRQLEEATKLGDDELIEYWARKKAKIERDFKELQDEEM